MKESSNKIDNDVISSDPGKGYAKGVCSFASKGGLSDTVITHHSTTA